MPGWEPERMTKVKELFAMYKDVDNEKLFNNLKYFLEKIMPVCDKYNINMAIHPGRSCVERVRTSPYHYVQGKYPAYDENGR